MDLVCSIYFCIDFIHSYDKALANVIRFFAKNNIASIKVRTYRKKTKSLVTWSFFNDVCLRQMMKAKANDDGFA